MPDISIIIPAYNRAELIGETLWSLLKQTIPAKEIILVDHGSTDGTAEKTLEAFGNWKLETGNWKQNFPSAGILAIDKESMEWDHIRTGKELHEFAIANFEGQPGPYVLMVDEVQGGIAA